MELSETELDTLVVCSVRYALGRRSYIVSDVCRIVSSCLPHISKNTISVVQRDIQDALISQRHGDDVDRQSWKGLLRDIHEKRPTQNE